MGSGLTEQELHQYAILDSLNREADLPTGLRFEIVDGVIMDTVAGRPAFRLGKIVEVTRDYNHDS